MKRKADFIGSFIGDRPFLGLVAGIYGKKSRNMLIIRNGRVIDPLNHVDAVCDLAIEGKQIVSVEKAMQPGEKDRVIDAEGCYVLPGLIDHHAHLAPLARIGIPSEAVCFASGVTTAVDAGSTGCANFIAHHGAVEQMRLSVRAYLNVTTTGLDTLPGCLEDVDPAHWDREGIRECFRSFGDILAGLKLRTSAPIVGKLGYEPLEATVELAEELGVPVMVHCTNPPGPLSELLNILRPGDTITHMYMNIGSSLIDEKEKILEAAYLARARGVYFEAADARAHFGLPVARAAIAQGFYPDFIATDLTRLSMYLRPTAFNLAMQISKYAALGIPFDKVVECVTVNPARELGLLDRAGSLTVGHPADITVFRPVDCDTVHGDRPYGDKDQQVFTGHKLYRPMLTVKNGEMVYRDMGF